MILLDSQNGKYMVSRTTRSKLICFARGGGTVRVTGDSVVEVYILLVNPLQNREEEET